MTDYKVLGVIVKLADEVIIIKPREVDAKSISIDIDLSDTGLVDIPTPAQIEVEKELEKPKQNLDTILDKYKEKAP